MRGFLSVGSLMAVLPFGFLIQFAEAAQAQIVIPSCPVLAVLGGQVQRGAATFRAGYHRSILAPAKGWLVDQSTFPLRIGVAAR